MNTHFEFIDEFGPEKIIELYDPATQLNAIVVVDNVAAGPAIGGVRMAQDVTVEECVRLARAMTLKNAMAGLAHGGGKSVIAADPVMAIDDKARLIRSFAHAIKDVKDYIVGPDMGTNETAMAQIQNVNHRTVGLPRELGGIPLDDIGATGYGLVVALEVAQSFANFDLRGARIVVQGFGSVGLHTARFLADKGAKLVGVSDSGGARIAPGGFDVHNLIAFKNDGTSVAQFHEGEALDPIDLIAVDCDVWIPAARPDVIHSNNVTRMHTKVVCQGANIPATVHAEHVLAEQGVLVIPDFVANAGGVICAAVEYHNGTQSQAMVSIDEKIRRNTHTVLSRAAQSEETPRDIASGIAHERLRRAMSYRRTY